MADTIKLALRLMLFALVSGLALAGVNALTEGPIREQAILKTNITREAVLPQADEFEPYDIANPEKYPEIDEVFSGSSDGQTVGFTFLISPYGYKGDIVMTLGVNADGSVNALSVVSQSETAGLGSRVADDEFLGQFPGAAADPDTIAGDIDTITGATVSSKAVLAGVGEALTFLRDEMGIAGVANPAVTGPRSTAEEKAIAEDIGAKQVSEMNPYETLGYPAIEDVYSAQMRGGSAYVIKLKVESNAAIRSTLIIGMDGVIRSLTVDEQHEGEGYGTRIAEEEFTGQFPGKTADDTLESTIDALTGATGTYTNFMTGIHQAVDYFQKYLKTEVTP